MAWVVLLSILACAVVGEPTESCTLPDTETLSEDSALLQLKVQKAETAQFPLGLGGFNSTCQFWCSAIPAFAQSWNPSCTTCGGLTTKKSDGDCPAWCAAIADVALPLTPQCSKCVGNGASRSAGCQGWCKALPSGPFGVRRFFPQCSMCHNEWKKTQSCSDSCSCPDWCDTVPQALRWGVPQCGACANQDKDSCPRWCTCPDWCAVTPKEAYPFLPSCSPCAEEGVAAGGSCQKLLWFLPSYWQVLICNLFSRARVGQIR